MDKKTLSERDICTKFITPALENAGWDKLTQVLEEVGFTDGKIIVRGKLTARGAKKRADYILYHKPNMAIAIIEAKDNKQTIGVGNSTSIELKNPNKVVEEVVYDRKAILAKLEKSIQATLVLLNELKSV